MNERTNNFHLVVGRRTERGWEREKGGRQLGWLNCMRPYRGTAIQEAKVAIRTGFMGNVLKFNFVRE